MKPVLIRETGFVNSGAAGEGVSTGSGFVRDVALCRALSTADDLTICGEPSHWE